MLLRAMDNFILNTRAYGEAKKAQYTDKGDVKNYFRASELGSSDRKIIYGFFKHQLPTIARSAKSCRQLTNGDKVHERYQTWWEDMGALISMEERLSSKDDDYLKEYEWEWAGHYDGLLDMNVLRAHALGKCKINYAKNEATDAWEMEVEVDDDYANEVGLFDDNYVPVTMVADIKTMNPWGFKRIKEKEDISEQQGYIDQISFYMYMLNTPYASIFVEDKGSNDVVEIQIVWRDMHDGVEYVFTPELHGEKEVGIVRLVIDNDRFFGTETSQGLVPRIQYLWETRKAIAEADSANDMATLGAIMPPRCSEDPSKFPCSWGGGAEKCEFFDHCWNQTTGGNAVKPYEACPADCIWEMVYVNSDTCEPSTVEIDSRKVPSGVTREALQALMAIGAVSIANLLVVNDAPKPIMEAEESAVNADDILGADGSLNLNMTVPSSAVGTVGTHVPSKLDAQEYKNNEGKKAIVCSNCGKELTYDRLANGGTKKCNFCSHVNKVIKL
jgi:hypothetical protein